MFVWCRLAVVLLVGCGLDGLFDENSGNPDAASGAAMDAGMPGPDGGGGAAPRILEEPTPIEDGISGGVFAAPDHGLVVTIPMGTVPKALRAHPVVNLVALPKDLVAPGEVAVGSAYQIDLASTAGFATSTDLTIVLDSKLTDIPVEYRTSRYVFAKVWDEDEELVLPVPGQLADGKLTLTLRGLARRATFTVVYNPSIQVALSASAHKPATQEAPWSTNAWVAIYDPRGAALNAAVVDVLGPATGNATIEQVAAVVKQKVTDNAAKAGLIYQTAGFRQPNLVVLADPALVGTAMRALAIVIQPTGGSKYRYGDRAHGGALRYGELIIEPGEIADVKYQQAHPGMGLMLEGVAHELLHAIQAGYDLGGGNGTQGLNEGTAATYGMTIDLAALTPQVRTANPTEVHKLSTYLDAPKVTRSEAYANQDFFAYVGRVYDRNSFGYLPAFFEQVRLEREAAIAAHRPGADLAPTRLMVLAALAKVTQARFHQDLGSIYFDYARTRAFEHTAPSRLRIDEPGPATLNAALFHAASAVRVSVDPTTLAQSALRGSLVEVQPFATAVLVVTPSKAVTGGVPAALTLTPKLGGSKSLRAVLYRGGVGTEVTATAALPKFGTAVGDVLTLLVVNTDAEQALTLDYQLGVQEVPVASTFTATIRIGGTAVPFTAVTIIGSFGEYRGGVVRTGLPTASASEGTLADPNHTTVELATEPAFIAGPGTYAMAGPKEVFENSRGAATLLLFTPAIRNGTDNEPVAFLATGGSVTFTAYGRNIGERMSASFTADVHGTRAVKKNPNGSIQEEELTGTVAGEFSVPLTAPAQ